MSNLYRGPFIDASNQSSGTFSETAWPNKKVFTENIYGGSSIRFPHIIQFGQKHGCLKLKKKM
jgi:hypothetical protein